MDETLSSEDRRHLVEFGKKMQLIKDRIVGVARRRHTGFFLGGRGGIGKSYVVEGELDRLAEPFKLWNSAMTPRCLFDRFAEYPDAIHFLEDIETLTGNRSAVSVLRSALWGTRRGRDGKMERLITWNARGSSGDVIFSGGVIMTSNRRLADLPELDALKTRISWMNLDVSDREIIALMRRVAVKGWPDQGNLLDPQQCKEVVEFTIEETSRCNRRPDLRLMINSFEDRIQFEDLETGCDWHDLIAARVRERPAVVGDIEPVGVRAQKKARQLEVAREITGLPPDERLKAWQERTGSPSRASMYRRLAELGMLDAMDFEN